MSSHSSERHRGVSHYGVKLLMEALGQTIDTNLLLLTWVMGRQSTGRLFSCSKDVSERMMNVYGQAGVHKQAAILHDVRRKVPLGEYQCPIDIDWLFMTIHVTADRPNTYNYTFIHWCPHCKRTFDCYLYAGVAYRYIRKLEGTLRILSEMDAASNEDLSDSEVDGLNCSYSSI